MTDILSYFPAPYKPRDIQTETLLELQAAWRNYDVFVINLPVASGKSYIAKTITDWTGQAAITTPTNLLVDQYRHDFPKLAGIYGKDSYACHNEAFSSCGSQISDAYRRKAKRKTCDNCPWFKDNKRVHSPYVKKYITNNHLYAQMRKFQSVLIADEAHNLIDFLQSRHSVSIDYDKFPYPRHTSYVSRDALREWLDNMHRLQDILDNKIRGQKGIRILHEELNTYSPKYLIKEQIEEQRLESGIIYEKKKLLLSPIDVRDMPPVLWPEQVRKIVLMSATIGEKDIEELGLSGRRVKYINADSCIPAVQRPVNFRAVTSVSGSNLNSSIQDISNAVLGNLDEHKGQKGLVHATYAQAKLLRMFLAGNDRIIWHNKTDKKRRYQEFRAATDDRVLVASGLYEGIDLPDDAGRFQIITKVPYPNLGEPAIKYRAMKDSKWYAWQATKTMLQACGRICRKPDDFGETYIYDSNFRNLYTGNPEQFPEWFKQSVKGI